MKINPSQPLHMRWVILALFLFCALLSAVVFFPMVTDEAYYMDWARSLSWPAWGFFDHPPFVSWQAGLAREIHSIQAARLGVWVASIVTFYFNFRIAREFLPGRRAAWLVALVAQSTLGGVANSFLLSPDSGLAMWWSIAIHEGLCAIKRNPRRWVTAGLATGAGLLSKYTMVLIGPVFLYALLRDSRKPLRSPWPYVGALVALLVFMPNLAWNKRNDWVTFKFQFGHGLSVRSDVLFRSNLPLSQPSFEGSSTMNLHRALHTKMNSVEGFAETKRKIHKEKSRMEAVWQYSGDYVGGVVALWGLYVFVWIYQFLLRRKEPVLKKPGSELLTAAAVFPLVFFGVICLFSKVEANWAAMHMIAGAVILVDYYRMRFSTVALITGIHLALAAILLLLFNNLQYLPSLRENRLVVESAGYDQLIGFVARETKSDLLAVDSYQLKSAIAARMPSLRTVQWPGITRGSEYTRGRADEVANETALLARADFYLLTFEDIPPELPGFTAVSLDGIRACPDGIINSYSVTRPVLPCEKGVRDWWLVKYEKVGGT